MLNLLGGGRNAPVDLSGKGGSGKLKLLGSLLMGSTLFLLTVRALVILSFSCLLIGSSLTFYVFRRLGWLVVSMLLLFLAMHSLSNIDLLVLGVVLLF